MQHLKLTAIFSLLTLLMSVLVTVGMTHTQKPVYTVNLGKILQAQMLIAGRMSAEGTRKKLWMTTIESTNGQLRQVIHRIAGNHLVVVEPAVVQGGHDITNQVLKALSLPTRIPKLTIAEHDIIPNSLPKANARAQTTVKRGPTWAMP